MLRQLGRRLSLGAGVVFAVVTVTFVLVSLAPGDPARLWVPPGSGVEELEAARRALGLDRPIAVRYAAWLLNFVRGDWGISLAQQRPVADIIVGALPQTVLLSGLSLLLTYAAGLTIGLLQAMKRRTVWDTGLTVAGLFVYGMPAYWLAIMLVLVFSYTAVRLGWPPWLQLPALGAQALDADLLTPWGRAADRLRHLVLPVATLTAIGAAGAARFVRGAVLDVRELDFVRAARAKGLRDTLVEVRHVLRNALLPVITLLGLSLPALFSGTVFVEVVFAWPGMGRVIVDAVGARDYPVVMATTAIFALLVVVGNLLADLLYAVADPRLRREAR
ncbi:MAG: ABC transporter permease [Gemmatimonadales bacterium]